MTDRHIEGLKQQQAELHHVSEHLANERTILAWVRTAIAVMTLGIAINRFSLFLIEFARMVPGGRGGQRPCRRGGHRPGDRRRARDAGRHLALPRRRPRDRRR